MASLLAGMCHGLGGIVPVSLIIERWFSDSRSTALGICSAGSGLATIIVPPIATKVITQFSLRTAFFLQAVAIALIVLAVICLVRDPTRGESRDNASSVHTPLKSGPEGMERAMDRIGRTCIYLAVMAVGSTSYGLAQNLSPLYIGEGFDPILVSYVISFYGIALLVGEIVYGRTADWLGVRFSSSLAVLCLAGGGTLCSLAGLHSTLATFLSILLLGLGLPVATVGISGFARDAGTSGEFSKLLKEYQLLISLGSIAIGPIPGIISDLTDSYVPAYALLAGIACAAFALIQAGYHRMRMMDQK